MDSITSVNVKFEHFLEQWFVDWDLFPLDLDTWGGVISAHLNFSQFFIVEVYA